jgi:hypothetical protein
MCLLPFSSNVQKYKIFLGEAGPESKKCTCPLRKRLPVFDNYFKVRVSFTLIL